MRQLRLVLLMIALAACNAFELQPRVVQSLPTLPTLAVQEPDVIAPTAPRTLTQHKPKKLYEGWSTWCESRPEPCPKDGRCSPDRNGQPRKCVRPWWSKKEKVCAISYSSPLRRKGQTKQVQQIVEAQCAGACNSAELNKFVRLIAMRESTMRPWKRHLLSGDVEYGQKIWRKNYRQYASVNRHYKQMERWGGNGLLGQQAVLFAPRWDEAAPPEILCRPTIAVATYLHCARATHRKQLSMGIVPTWETLHASCSGGDIRPKGPSPDFRRRAARLGLDPDQKVPYRWLGVSPGKSVEVRNATAAAIETMVQLAEAKKI